MKIAILGNGGFGTAMALVARARGHTASLWGHDPAYTEELARTRSNPRYLPDVEIPDDILISPDPAQVLDGVEVVLMAVPTQHVRAVMSKLQSAIPARAPVVSLAKGLEQETARRPSQILHEVLGAGHQVLVLSGPSHAEEVALGQPATVVLAGSDGNEVAHRTGRTPAQPLLEGMAQGPGARFTVGLQLEEHRKACSFLLSADKVMDVFTPGTHGSTYGGNPLACAVAEAALDVLVDEDLFNRSRELGNWFLEEMRALASPHIKEVRGAGLWIGVEIHPEAGGARRFCEALMGEGMLCKETHTHTIRFAPPLVIEKQELSWALERIAKVLA